MTTSFPTALDSRTRPGGDDALGATGLELDVVVDDILDMIEALEAKVGIDGSADTDSIDYLLARAAIVALRALTPAANKIPMFSGASTATLIDFKDQDDMASDSATAVPSQQSVKAYVDNEIAGVGGGTLASPVSNTTATNESTTSTSYVAPTTARSVSITPVGTRIRVTLVAYLYGETASYGAYASVAVSGGATSAADDARCITHVDSVASLGARLTLVQDYTVSAGVSTTVAVRIKSDGGGIAHILNQYLLVEEVPA